MDEFDQWLRDVGKLNKACSIGKTYMVNPKAMKTLMDISDFFHQKSNEYVAKFKKLGFNQNPYTIETMKPEPALKKSITLRIVTNDSDGIDFSSADIQKLHQFLNENVTMSIMGTTTPERFQIWFVIEDYFIEVKSN